MRFLNSKLSAREWVLLTWAEAAARGPGAPITPLPEAHCLTRAGSCPLEPPSHSTQHTMSEFKDLYLEDVRRGDATMASLALDDLP